MVTLVIMDGFGERKEKFGNAEIFDIGLKLLEKYDIIKYIGAKRLFFTIDNDFTLLSLKKIFFIGALYLTASYNEFLP